jgi:hypothetical protein
MFAVGTEHARDLLNTLTAGRWYDDEDGSTRQLAPEAATNLRARAIELGRELRAEAGD